MRSRCTFSSWAASSCSLISSRRLVRQTLILIEQPSGARCRAVHQLVQQQCYFWNVN